MVAIDLPSNDGAAGLADDAAAVRAALDGIGEPALVVGHSYGGIAISEGAAGPHAAALLYLCAFMLESGQALLDAMRHELPPWIAVDEAAGSHLAQDTERSLYGDCPPDVAECGGRAADPPVRRGDRHAADRRGLAGAAEHLRDLRSGPGGATAGAGRDGLTRSAVERLPSSHSPFLSRPDDVAAIVLAAL